MSKKKITGTVSDPTLPKTPITIDGKEYNLCFDLGALAEAEYALNREGANVNLLTAIPVLNLSSTTILFAAGLRTFHPDISFKEAKRMVTLGNVYAIAGRIAEAWQLALPEPDPTQAVGE